MSRTLSQAKVDMSQVETLSKRTIFFHVTNLSCHIGCYIYHDCKTSKCCNRCIFSLTTYELLQYAVSFFLHSSGIL